MARSIKRIHALTDKQDLGDKAIIHMMRHEYAEAAKKGKVFVLTEDGGIVRAIGEDKAICCRQLNHDLAATRLNWDMGIKPGTPYQRIESEWLEGETSPVSPVTKTFYGPDYSKAHPFHDIISQVQVDAALPDAHPLPETQTPADTPSQEAQPLQESPQVAKFRRQQEAAQRFKSGGRQS